MDLVRVGKHAVCVAQCCAECWVPERVQVGLDDVKAARFRYKAILEILERHEFVAHFLLHVDGVTRVQTVQTAIDVADFVLIVKTRTLETISVHDGGIWQHIQQKVFVEGVATRSCYEHGPGDSKGTRMAC
jgi:hypothetical protein